MCWAIFLAIGASPGTPVLAQGVPILQRGNLDLTGFGASVFGSALGGVTVGGTGQSPGSSANGAFTLGAPSSNGGGGVRIAWAMARRVRLYGEWAYIAGGRNNYNSIIIATAPGTNPSTLATFQQTFGAETSFQDAIGGLEWLFPMRRMPKVVPYVNVGVGVIALGGGASGSNIGTAPVPGATFSGPVTGTHAVGNGGLGIRYYFTERAGLRFELDGVLGPQFHASSGSSSVAIPNGATHLGRFVYGFFFQIH